MIYLITGSAGFIGKKLVKKLVSNNHKVIGLDINYNNINHNNFFQFKVDLSNLKKIKKILFKFQKIDVLIHTSALQPINTEMNIFPYVKNNFIPAINILESVLEKKVKKIIVCSSLSVYGKPKFNPISENDNLQPSNAYGFSKLLMEKTFEYYSKIYNLNMVILRFDGIFGYNQNMPGFINMAIDTLINEQKLILYNKGNQKRNQVYVDEVISSIILSIKTRLKEKFIIFNISGFKPIKNKDLAIKIKKILNSKSEIILSNKGNPIRNFDIYMKNNKAKRMLKFKSMPLQNSLKLMINEYLQNNEK